MSLNSFQTNQRIVDKFTDIIKKYRDANNVKLRVSANKLDINGQTIAFNPRYTKNSSSKIYR